MVRERHRFERCRRIGNVAGQMLRLAVILVVLGNLISWFFTVEAVAQERFDIPLEPSCEQCRIEVARLHALRRTDGSIAFQDRPRSIRRVLNGGYLLIADNGGIEFYDSTGMRDARSVGIVSGTALVGNPHDLMRSWDGRFRVIDPSRDDITVFAPTGKRLHTSPFAFPVRRSGVVLGEDRLVLNLLIRDRDRVGYPLHLVTKDGRIIESFGANPPDYVLNAPPTWMRVFSLAVDENAVWVAHQHEYTVEKWRLDEKGIELESILSRAPIWFPKSNGLVPVTLDEEPQVMLLDVSQDTTGLHWVLSLVPGHEWRSGLCSVPHVDSGREYVTPCRPQLVFDSILEVIDPSSARVVTATRVPECIIALLGNGHLVGYEAGDDGGVVTVYVSTLAGMSH